MSSLTSTTFAALTGAIGRELNDLAGLRLTRLMAATAAGSSTLVVEHSYDWPAPTGTISIDGVTYHYTGNDLNGTLSGIYVVVGGVQIANTQVQHNFNDTVIDVSKTYSALDQVREALLVGYASGDDLTTIGRNLGVPRAPTIKSDAQFRAIVEAMAYNPQATLYGLSLVLNAIVGSTTISGTTTVTAGSIALANVPTGTAVGQTVTGTGIPINTTVTSVYGTSANMSAPATTSGSFNLTYAAPNWSITEDLINNPCQITVTIPGSYFLNAVPQGQSYLTAATTLQATSGTLAPYVAATGQTFTPRASSIMLSPINLVTNARVARPSADTQAFTANGTGGTSIWTYVGSTAETTAMVPYTSGGVQIGYRTDGTTSSSVNYYKQALPVLAGSDASVSIVTTISYALLANSVYYVFLQLNDGAVQMCAFVYASGTGQWQIGLLSTYGTSLASIFVTPGTYFTSFTEYRLHKRGTTAVDLMVNGTVVLTVPYASFTATTAANNALAGAITYAQGGLVYKQISTSCINAIDYWNAMGTNGSVASTAATTFNATGMALTSADVGKQLRITCNPTQSSLSSTTSGSTQITGAPSTVVAGQSISGVNIPAGATVASISGTTVTMSTTATATGTAYLTYGQVTNAQGGNNNCVMQVQSGSTTSAALLDSGQQIGAQLTGGTTTQRIVINTPSGSTNVFTYPDDLGKTINIDNSSLGQSGAYTIVRLFDPVTGLNFATEYATTAAQQSGMTKTGAKVYTNLSLTTNICEVNQYVSGVLQPSEPVFVPESNLTYDIQPAFVNETGLTWELSDAGSMTIASGTSYNVTPRQALPLASAYYDVVVDNVPSAQILTNALVQNSIVAAGPPATFTYWPFYVTDPYNVVETYLNLIVAAGVQVNFIFT